MANNQATQEESEWTNNKEMNIKENSSTTDSVKDEPQIESTWRASEGENAVKPTEFSTGGAGKSSAEQTDRPNKAENKD